MNLGGPLVTFSLNNVRLISNYPLLIPNKERFGKIFDILIVLFLSTLTSFLCLGSVEYSSKQAYYEPQGQKKNHLPHPFPLSTSGTTSELYFSPQGSVQCAC